MIKGRIGILIGFILISSISCKKGENDPFLSLQSRKSRMHGDWEIAAFDRTEKISNVDGSYVHVSESFNDGIITVITLEYVATGQVTTVTEKFITVDNVNYNFDKNGSWSIEFTTSEVFTSMQDIGGGITSYDTVLTKRKLEESGDWSFLGKLEGQYKNKERIVMNVISRTETEQMTSHNTQYSTSDTTSNTVVGNEEIENTNYYSGEMNTIIEIDKLKRKEMVFIERSQISGELTIIPYLGNPTINVNDTFESETVLSLQKL